MAKFIKTFENEVIENRLTFRGMDFTITMIPYESGLRSKEKSLDIQLRQVFTDDENIDEIAETADALWYADETDIQDILEQLEYFEQQHIPL